MNLKILSLLIIEVCILLPDVCYAFFSKDVHLLNMQNGLADNTVSAVYKDKEGFVWFGTRNGLSRYDGRRITNFEISSSYPSISNLKEAFDGVLAFVDNGVFSAFDLKKERFLSVVSSSGQGIPSRGMLQKNDSLVWVISGSELHLMKRCASKEGELRFRVEEKYTGWDNQDNLLVAITYSSDKKSICLIDEKGRIILLDATNLSFFRVIDLGRTGSLSVNSVLYGGHVVQEDVLPGLHHVGGQQHLVPQVPAPEVFQNVLAGEQPGDVHRAAEEVVVHRQQVDTNIMAFPPQSVKKLVEELEAALPGGDGHAAGGVRQLQILQGPVKLVLEVAHHAHAVFNLGEILVELQGRDGPACQQIQLVRGIHRAGAPLRFPPGAPALQDVQGLPGGLLVKGHQGVQALPVAGEAHRHTGHAEKPLPQGPELLQSVLQGGAVVDAGAQHNLAVEVDAPLRQPVQVAQGVPGEPVVHHGAAQLGVHGVH